MWDHHDGEDTTLLISEWTFEGVGYATDGDAALAAQAEAAAREWRQLAKFVVPEEESY